MALIAKKKKTVRARVRTGLPAVPINTWEQCKNYFHQEIDKKDGEALTKTWIKKNFTKDEVTAIFANPSYHFYMFTHYSAIIHWLNCDLPLTDKNKLYPVALKNYFTDLIASGKELLKNQTDIATTSNVIVLSPRERLSNKINETVMVDIDDLEDQWMNNEQTTIDLYNRFKLHALTGSAADVVRRRVEGFLLDYSDAYHKRCDQAVEGYSHVARKEQKRRIEVCNTMLEDLNKIKAATKAVRKIRMPKAKAADKQVARLKFQKEDTTYKLVSINPVTIIGAMRLFAFNTKTRMISEYVSVSTKGFEVSGTSLKNVDIEISRCTRLRKPDDFLPIVQSKSVKQIDTAFKALTTKLSVPNGRINEDTILIKVLNN